MKKKEKIGKKSKKKKRKIEIDGAAAVQNVTLVFSFR